MVYTKAQAKSGWESKAWARRQNAASSFLYKKWWYSTQQDLPMSVLLKTLYFQSTLQRQQGSKALSILTYMPKVYLLCGGRDTQEQVLKSLTTPNWPAQCDVGTRCKYMCCNHVQVPCRYSCSLSSATELNSARQKHPSSSASISFTPHWGAAQNAYILVTCVPVSSALLVIWGPPHRAHSGQPQGNTRKSKAFYKAWGTTFPTATLLTAQLTLCYA